MIQHITLHYSILLQITRLRYATRYYSTVHKQQYIILEVSVWMTHTIPDEIVFDRAGLTDRDRRHASPKICHLFKSRTNGTSFGWIELE